MVWLSLLASREFAATGSHAQAHAFTLATIFEAERS